MSLYSSIANAEEISEFPSGADPGGVETSRHMSQAPQANIPDTEIDPERVINNKASAGMKMCEIKDNKLGLSCAKLRIVELKTNNKKKLWLVKWNFDRTKTNQ